MDENLITRNFRLVVDRGTTDPVESNLSAIIEHVRKAHVTDTDIAYLSTALARSGVMFRANGDDMVDVASTGGPSSLSTLLVPLYLRALGRRVVKLAVPGRPAGGIDVLGTIPGFRVILEPSEVKNCINNCGYVHFLADKRYAPMDAKLFAYRQKVGAQGLAPLVIASLLAKKLVVGLRQAGLDVRVADHGNFGNTWDQAKRNAERFCSVARILGLRATCFLTDATRPYQPGIGRGEALLALDQIFRGNESNSLKRHMRQCWNMAVAVAGADRCLELPSGEHLQVIFQKNLVAQGSSLASFDDRVQETLQSSYFELKAERDGYVVVKMDRVRSALVEVQRSVEVTSTTYSDPAGIQLLVEAGEHVTVGRPLALVRTTEEFQRHLKNSLSQSISIDDHLPARPLAQFGQVEEVWDE